ncbi:hypothetical protein C8R44DRAFT_803005 [Mycena epipterygia]|nr:hypothetical protein C8R44DRAFT_803005 [Mycena epipterygia]
MRGSSVVMLMFAGLQEVRWVLSISKDGGTLLNCCRVFCPPRRAPGNLGCLAREERVANLRRLGKDTEQVETPEGRHILLFNLKCLKSAENEHRLG